MHAYGVRRLLLPQILEWSKHPSNGIDLDALSNPLEKGLVEGYTLWPVGVIQRPLTKMRNSLINEFEDWRRSDVFRQGESTAEKVGVDYGY
ncbi:hypothetical protein NEOLI_003101 [Neolecta irregularis DAH-3]|uniref:Uncharacterized protein n=1 Tax=Neolecta irregularis (strain DAH-3) TaxID=1198029 RepID=A0A1U7LJJ1_NEOID|nr:hypothetical protein NEOLI_003101 [Neolecta irregularis DAH-3]|eukprot:OLL22691.1 hypothetical protein NEOLI_003101 [Neolecta irregularis DAH-3]